MDESLIREMISDYKETIRILERKVNKLQSMLSQGTSIEELKNKKNTLEKNLDAKVVSAKEMKEKIEKQIKEQRESIMAEISKSQEEVAKSVKGVGHSFGGMGGGLNNMNMMPMMGMFGGGGVGNSGASYDSVRQMVEDKRKEADNFVAAARREADKVVEENKKK